MYCTHCGKQNSDDMLFCGYCGKPLESPDEEEKLGVASDADAVFGPPRSREPIEPPIQRKTPPARIEVPVPDELPGDEDIPRPADDFLFERDTDPLPRPILKQPVQLRAKRPPTLSRTGTLVEPQNAVGTRSAKTVIPRRETPAFDMDDIFMEEEPDDFSDDFSEKGGYLYEEPENPSFFIRHVRGIVATALLLITVIIVGYWLIFGAGQRVLGHLYISSNPKTYVTLGDEANQNGSYEVAGAYYLKALSLAPKNQQYAIKAANAYITAGNTGQAALALKGLIEIDPSQVDPYVTLKALYPDALSRPAWVSELLQQGYAATGDERLKDS